MSSVKEDWILWANRFQTEHITLLKRVQEVESHATQIPTLQSQLDKLANGYKGLQQSNDQLGERTLHLEENAAERYKNTEEELSALRARVTALEQEKENASCELKRWKSQALALLEKEYGQVQQEILQWKTQMEATQAQRAETRSSTGSKDIFDQNTNLLDTVFHRPSPKLQRTFSEATTADESLLLTQHNNGDTCESTNAPQVTRDEQPLSHATILHHTKQISAAQSQRQYHSPLSQPPIQDIPFPAQAQAAATSQALQPQGRRTLEDYVTAGGETLPAMIQDFEAGLVKEFVEKMREKHRKKMLWGILEEKGWKWAVAEREIRDMIEEGKRRKRERGRRRAAL